MDKFDLYRDIASRTGGDIYVGVVGPVRTGKSTLIKQVMQQFVIDGIANPDERSRAVDEIPQSADGKTIMTTQPRFVPNEAVRVSVGENITVNMRLIDCVGYLVDGALGAQEDGTISLFLLPTCSNSFEASMKSVWLSVLLFLRTMMQVAMVTPKKRLPGSWMTVSMKLLSMRYLRIFCSAPPR